MAPLYFQIDGEVKHVTANMTHYHPHVTQNRLGRKLSTPPDIDSRLDVQPISSQMICEWLFPPGRGLWTCCYQCWQMKESTPLPSWLLPCFRSDGLFSEIGLCRPLSNKDTDKGLELGQSINSVEHSSVEERNVRSLQWNFNQHIPLSIRRQFWFRKWGLYRMMSSNRTAGSFILVSPH